MLMTLGQKIKAAREALGMNQDELAELLGVEPPTVSRWENGVIRPKSKRLKTIAEKLGKPVEWFQELTVKAGDFEARLAALEERTSKAYQSEVEKNAEWFKDLQVAWDQLPADIQLELVNLAFTAIGDPKYAKAFAKASAERVAIIKHEEHTRRQLEAQKKIERERSKKKSVGSR